MHFFQPKIPKKNVDLGLDAWRKAWKASGNDPSRLSLPQVPGRTVGFTSSQREYFTELQHPTNRGYELTRVKGHRKTFTIETSKAKRIRNREIKRAADYFKRNKRKSKRASPKARKRRRRYSPKTPRKSATQPTKSKPNKKKSNPRKKRNAGATETAAVIYGQSNDDSINSRYEKQEVIDLTTGTQTPGSTATKAPPSPPTRRSSRSPTTDTEPDSLDYGSSDYLQEQMDAAEAHSGLPVKKLPRYQSWPEMGKVMKRIREVLFTAFLFLCALVSFVIFRGSAFFYVFFLFYCESVHLPLLQLVSKQTERAYPTGSGHRNSQELLFLSKFKSIKEQCVKTCWRHSNRIF